MKHDEYIGLFVSKSQSADVTVDDGNYQPSNLVRSRLKYSRVLLKVSGEYFSDQGEPIHPQSVQHLAEHICELTALGVQVAVVLGAGNLCRGKLFAEAGFDQVQADHMGMLATVMNALALKDTLLSVNQACALRSAFEIPGIAQGFVRDEALNLLAQQQVVICAGGSGNPLVTTDTAAALRAIELKVDVLLKATKVDGIYSADPIKYPDARLYSEISYQEVLAKQLKVMDLSAFCLVKDHNLPIRIFNMHAPGVFKQLVMGDPVGTLVHSGDHSGE